MNTKQKLTIILQIVANLMQTENTLKDLELDNEQLRKVRVSLLQEFNNLEIQANAEEQE